MIRVLVDENMPRKLRRDLSGFAIRTVQEQGLAAFRNGELLARAAAEFEVFVTIDQRMRHQQNLSMLQIGIVVIEVRDAESNSSARFCLKYVTQSSVEDRSSSSVLPSCTRES